MALGKRKPVQQPLFVSTAHLAIRPHPFYEAVNKFDARAVVAAAQAYKCQSY